ncbi:MAG: hypothetical protein OXG62_12695 [Nitrospinae bacterium]|nr:hypothetical protein [Nitrospinota bacterium]
MARRSSPDGAMGGVYGNLKNLLEPEFLSIFGAMLNQKESDI